MGLFGKKLPVDKGQYHIPIEMVLMNYHDIHLAFIEQFEILAATYFDEQGPSQEAVEAAGADVMAAWESIEAQIREKLDTDAGVIRDDAVKNGLTKYYDDYVTERIAMFRFALSYRMMNAYIAFCEERGIEMSPDN